MERAHSRAFALSVMPGKRRRSSSAAAPSFSGATMRPTSFCLPGQKYDDDNNKDCAADPGDERRIHYSISQSTSWAVAMLSNPNTYQPRAAISSRE